MVDISKTLVAISPFLLLVGNVTAQVSTPTLLDEICHGKSAIAAEQQLESRGAADSITHEMLSERLPLMLSQTKDVKSVILLARLAGALKLVSTIPALSELLTDDRNKSMSTTLYQAAELIDDPVGAALARIGEPAVAQVSTVLRSPHPLTRFRAVYVLTKIGTPEALSALRGASKNETDPEVRGLIMGSLAARPTPSAPRSQPH